MSDDMLLGILVGLLGGQLFCVGWMLASLHWVWSE